MVVVAVMAMVVAEMALVAQLAVVVVVFLPN